METLESRRVLAYSQVLVDDANSNISSAVWDPTDFTAVGSTVFFVASTSAAGRELWKTDGTAAGTVLVKDIYVGDSDSLPDYLVNMNGTLYFAASDAVGGRELWKSNGTAAGTVRVADIVPDSFGSNPQFLTNVAGKLYFRAASSLWKSGGTAATTVRVRDAAAPKEYPREIAAVGNVLYFKGYDSAGNYEIWKSDGTNAGTVRLKDIFPGTGSGLQPGEQLPLVNVNGKCLFVARTSNDDYELWKTDGTAAGTVRIKDIYSGTTGSRPASLVAKGSTLFFVAGDATGGREIWKSDGTSGGTTRLVDLYAGTTSSEPRYLTNVSGTIFFRARNINASADLWKTNGTAAGTVRVRNIGAGGAPLSPRVLANANGTLFFDALQNDTGYELWKTDGSSNGTTLVKDLNAGTGSSNVREPVFAHGLLLFKAQSVNSGNYNLWKSNGTKAGTVELKNFDTATGDSRPQAFANISGSLFFRATDSGSDGNSQLWKSDGTPSHTVRLSNVAGGAYLKNLTNVNGTGFFTGYDGQSGYELWKSDGTAAGTVRIKDIYPGNTSSNPTRLTNLNGKLVFAATDATGGTELWKSDGTAAGTVRLKDIETGTGSSTPSYLTTVGGILYFQAFSAGRGIELWKSNGTPGGTVLVADIAAGANTSTPRFFVNVSGTCYFTANPGTGDEVWKTNGTAAGTVPVRTEAPSYPKNLTNIGGTLFFSGYDSTHGYELWTSKGTNASTKLVFDLNPGSSYGNPNHITDVKGTAFFVTKLSTGYELWKSDGTAAGTKLVKNILPNPASTDLLELTNYGGKLFFVASDTNLHHALWQSNGTAAGTIRAQNAGTGQTPTEVDNLTVVGNRLFFSGTSDLYGEEVYRYNLIAQAFPKSATTDEDKSLTTGNVIATALADGPVTVTFNATSAKGGTVTFNKTAGAFTYKPKLNFNGSDSFKYTIRDYDGEKSTATITINVKPVNDTPTALAISKARLAENLPSGTIVGTLSTTDVDVGDSFTYKLVSGTGSTDNASFTISGNSLRTSASFNFEVKKNYLVRVRSTDSGGKFVEKAFTITVTNVNEPPSSLTLSANTVAENLPSGTTVGTFSATDPDAGNTTFTYKLVSGTGSTDNSKFTITGNVLKTAASFNFEAKSNYAIRVRVTDVTGKVREQAFTIQVSNTNDAPVLNTALSPTLDAVSEDATAPAGTLVSKLVAGISDADPGALKGIAVVGADAANGKWEYRLKGTAVWKTLGSVSESFARLLPSDDATRVRFIPKSNFNGTALLSYRAWDRTQGSAGAAANSNGNTGGVKTFSVAKESASLSIVAVNDAPSIAVGSPVGYVHNAAAITLAAAAVVADIDSANFATGKLQVRITTGGGSANQLAIGSGFTVDGSNNVKRGTTIIGKLTSNGQGTTALVVTLNANATKAIVQQLARAITFKTSTAGTRAVLFSVSDGDGGTSAEVTKTVNVT